MQPIYGGLIIAVGLAWIGFWLGGNVFLARGLTGQRPGAAFKPRLPGRNAELDEQGRRAFADALSFMRTGLPVAVLAVIAGIVIAVTS